MQEARWFTRPARAVNRAGQVLVQTHYFLTASAPTWVGWPRLRQSLYPATWDPIPFERHARGGGRMGLETKGSGGTQSYSQSGEALAAYEDKAKSFEAEDPRDQYTYMYSKMRSDYTLLELVGVHNKSVLNVGCSFPVDELYYARKVA